jgi:hypothetical protein
LPELVGGGGELGCADPVGHLMIGETQTCASATSGRIATVDPWAAPRSSAPVPPPAQATTTAAASRPRRDVRRRRVGPRAMDVR